MGVGIRKGCGQDDLLFPRGDAHQVDGDGVKLFPGPAFPQFLPGILAEGGLRHGFGFITVDEVLEDPATAVTFQPEQGMYPAPVEVIKQFKRDIPPVHDHDVIDLQGGEVAPGGRPFTGMGREWEGDWNPVTGTVGTGDQSLGTMGLPVWCRVSLVNQGSGKVHPGSVNGQDPVPLPPCLHHHV